MKLEAAQRLVTAGFPRHTAEQVQQLQEFYKGLDPKQQAFLMDRLPILIRKWFEGDFMSTMNKKGKVSDQLNLQAATYLDTDALAVALLHLKPIFKPVIPTTLYRTATMVVPPKKDTIEVSTKNHKRPLTSWSPKKNVEVAQSMIVQENGIVLTWSPVNPKLVIASWLSIMQLCSAVRAVEGKVFYSDWRIAQEGVGDTLYRGQDEYLV